jgi:hypothetical protein
MKMNRRGFFKKLARNTAVAAIGVAGGVLAVRNNKQDCNNSFICKNCSKLDDCEHPEADFYRKRKGIKIKK